MTSRWYFGHELHEERATRAENCMAVLEKKKKIENLVVHVVRKVKLYRCGDGAFAFSPAESRQWLALA